MTAIGPKECPKANVLNALPKTVPPKAKAHLKEIWMAESKAEADIAFDFFVEAYGVKYDRAVKCLIMARVDLLAFYDCPAEHWKHIRTRNPIESTFATVRHRTTKAKDCLSRQTALAMTHQLMLSARKKWRKIDGQNRLLEIIQALLVMFEPLERGKMVPGVRRGGPRGALNSPRRPRIWTATGNRRNRQDGHDQPDPVHPAGPLGSGQGGLAHPA